ncbi:MAG: HPr-rel-A system PqqD family peptide chaperone [Burkholderiales bacterium]|nr:HPr-rel-A system PqqD family peptide chaperone [Burkholderiales bacterium]
MRQFRRIVDQPGGGADVQIRLMEEVGTVPVRWRIVLPDRVRIVRLDDAVIVFNPLSWQTHFLNEAAWCVFDALRSGPMTVDALIGECVEGGDGMTSEDRNEWTRILNAHLAELAAMGLVMRDDAVAA